MNDEDNIVKVDLKTETICCDGGQDSLGHPAVYYTFNQSNEIVCSCLLYTSPSPRDRTRSRMPSSA